MLTQATSWLFWSYTFTVAVMGMPDGTMEGIMNVCKGTTANNHEAKPAKIQNIWCCVKRKHTL